jgi:hypothetical protein
VTAPFPHLDPEEAAPLVPSWADATNAETRRQMGVAIGEELWDYSSPPDRVHALRRWARAYLSQLITDEEAAACVAADVVRAREILCERQRQGAAAFASVEALMHSLRERRTSALAEGDTQRRLAQVNKAQVFEVGDRLQALQPDIAKAWTAEETRQLLKAWER